MSAHGRSKVHIPKREARRAAPVGALGRAQAPILGRAARGIALAALLGVSVASAQTPLLSRQNLREFRSTHACPFTGLKRNACPGWTIALVTPRCAGGVDSVANMKWYPQAAALAKESAERHDCTEPRL